MQPSKTKTPGLNWKLVISLAICWLIALTLRLPDSGRSLWLDELHTSWTVVDGLPEVMTRAAEGNQSPLYFWAVWIVTRIVGHTEFGLRLLSILAGSLLAPAIGWVSYRMTGRVVPAVFAAVLLALDPYFFHYAQEARPYAVLQLVGLFQLYFFLSRFLPEHWHQKIESTGWHRWAFVGCSILCCYLHFTAALLLICQFLFLIVREVISEEEWNRAKLLPLTDFLWIGVGCLPLAWHVLRVAARRSNWELFVNDYQFDPSIRFQLLGYLLIPGCLLLLAMILKLKVPKGVAAILVCYLGPILLSWILLKTNIAALYFSRYFLIGWSSAILFCVVSSSVWLDRTSSESGSERRFVKARTIVFWICLVSSFSITVSQNGLLKRFRLTGKIEAGFASTWKSTIELVNERIEKQNDRPLVFLMPNLIEDRLLADSVNEESDEREMLISYCQFPVKGIYSLKNADVIARPTLVGPRFTMQDRAPMLERGSVWLIIRGSDSLVEDIFFELAEFGKHEKLEIEPLKKLAIPMRGSNSGRIVAANFQVRLIQTKTPSD